MSKFYPLEVVGRDSETQFQVGEKFNLISIYPLKPEFTIVIFIHYKPRIAVAILDL